MKVCDKILKVEKKPLISVIVPAYNIEEYLPKCLESILKQNYKNIQIVLVDDGSNDMTGQIADQYHEKHPDKIKCLHLKNGGVLNARLKGIALATGEWIGFVDGDDEIEFDMYERLVNNAYKYDADISHCGFQIISKEREIRYFYNTGRIIEQNRTTGIRDLLTGEFVEPSLCNKIFKKSLFISLCEEHILKERIRINEDLLMNYLLFKQANNSVYEDFCPYHYISRSTSASHSSFQPYKVLDKVKVRKFIFDDVEIENKDLACQRYLVFCMQAYAALHEDVEQKETCLELKKELLTYRKKWKFLRKEDWVKLKLILLSPRLYNIIYNFYERYFQKKVYE